MEKDFLITDKFTGRIAVCAANKVGWEVIDYLTSNEYPITFVVTSIVDGSAYEQLIAQRCADQNIKVYRRKSVNDPAMVEIFRQAKLDLVLLAWWPTIVKKPAIDSVRLGWLNMHPSLLPNGRGRHPYYWAIIENTSFGVTFHFIDEKIDAGENVFQEAIPVDITDTGETLYKKSQETFIQLFKNVCPRIWALDLKKINKNDTKYKLHLLAELDGHSCIDLEKHYNAGELINIIRARTFFEGPSAFFYQNGKKYYIRVQIKEAKEQET